MREFVTLLTGGMQAPLFLALVFYALFGAALSLLLHTTGRDVDSRRTPIDFCWKFFFLDNWKRILTTLMLIYIALRFTPELFEIEITPFWALVIGLGNDKLAQLLKDKTKVLGGKIKTTITLLLIFTLPMLFGCMSVQKATNYLDKKGELPKLCANRYPVQDSKVIIRERVTVDTVLGTSYIYIDTSGKPKPCPPAKMITKTIYRDTTIYKRDRAYEAVLQGRLDAKQELIDKLLQDNKFIDSTNKQLKKKLFQEEKDKRDWQWKAIFTWVLIGVLGLFLLKKSLKL